MDELAIYSPSGGKAKAVEDNCRTSLFRKFHFQDCRSRHLCIPTLLVLSRLSVLLYNCYISHVETLVKCEVTLDGSEYNGQSHLTTLPSQTLLEHLQR